MIKKKKKRFSTERKKFVALSGASHLSQLPSQTLTLKKLVSN